VSFAWNQGDDDGGESSFTYYDLAIAKSAAAALARLHQEVQRRRIELAEAMGEPIGQYVESDADEDGRALIEAYWDCATVLGDCLNGNLNALAVGDGQTVEDAIKDIGFALKVIERMGLADW
jgi:hypothetical protein